MFACITIYTVRTFKQKYIWKKYEGNLIWRYFYGLSDSLWYIDVMATMIGIIIRLGAGFYLKAPSYYL